VKRYGNLEGDSGVVAYQSNAGSILVKFVNGSIYLYDHRRPGPGHVAEMQRRAAAGRGLSTYISQIVKDAYARRVN